MTDKVNLLVIGEGGREFAIAKKLTESDDVAHVYCAPGNVGMPSVGIETVDISENDFASLIKFAQEHNVKWTFVGPEDCLVDGIVDEFHAAGLKIFGPDARTAQLEGSKEYALNFMNNNEVPTAKYASYRDQTVLLENVDQFGYPVVIKENGLAGGKGVVIAQGHNEAVETIKEMFVSGQARIVLEECLTGPEYSMFVVVSNDHYRILPMAQDHKRAYDEDRGPNTGGMGAYSPLPQLSVTDRQRMIDEVVNPTITGLVNGGFHYHGILYIGLILTKDGPKVIEYNVRLGDPETQVVLPRLETDLYQLIDAAIDDRPLPEIKENSAASFGVVLASQGYPQKPLHGQKIALPPDSAGIEIDYANVTGTLADLRGAGGRLLMVVAQGATLQEAHDRVYAYLKKAPFPGCFYRHDIGAKAGL